MGKEIEIQCWKHRVLQSKPMWALSQESYRHRWYTYVYMYIYVYILLHRRPPSQEAEGRSIYTPSQEAEGLGVVPPPPSTCKTFFYMCWGGEEI